MGKLTFLLPEKLDAEAARELERACVAGGPDCMPWVTRAQVQDHRLIINRDVDESGFVLAPWEIPGTGYLMGATTTLMERQRPYHFEIELARGKVNQLRCQAEDWRSGGLVLPAALKESIREATFSFGHAILEPADSQPLARRAATSSYRAAHELAQAYISQVFRVRHERHPRLEIAFGCRLGSVPQPEHTQLLGDAFNHIDIPFPWSSIEKSERVYCWDGQDALVEWADEQSFPVTAGPLIDFSASQLPPWLTGRPQDLSRIAWFATEYVVAAIKRYRDRIRRWHVITAANNASVLSLTEEDLLRLTIRIAQTARQLDPEAELILGLAQPWGEYLATQERAQSPFLFGETLIRSDLNLAALDMELVMGVRGRGSYCRDLLETSRLLDLYALLGVPLRVTLGYPSAAVADENADPELAVHSGNWRGEINPTNQAEWAATYAAIVLCKPYVQSVQWAHLADAGPHQFPNCGLIDAAGQPKPALDSLRLLRREHLR